MASTKESQRYTEISGILQLLQTIHKKLLPNGMTTVRPYKKRCTLPMDRRTGKHLFRIAGYTYFITCITAPQLRQTVYTYHRCKRLCCGCYFRTRCPRTISPGCFLLQITPACRRELQNT